VQITAADKARSREERAGRTNSRERLPKAFPKDFWL